MWDQHWRDSLWNQLDRPWDVIVVGGGITGAGIFREAARLGWRALLVEQRDFAWGTSSRSSKLVHGGLRYLLTGDFHLMRASVQERERLLAEGQGLVGPLGFLLAAYKGDRPGRLALRAGIAVYHAVSLWSRTATFFARLRHALAWTFSRYTSYLPPHQFALAAPHLTVKGLQGGFHYGDAQTDDARLVLRVLREGMADGGVALNYVTAESLLREHQTADDRPPTAASGQSSAVGGRPSVAGIRLRDGLTGRAADVRGRVVVNATGAWADRLRGQVGAPPRLRPLRGSHLLFPAWRFPVAQSVGFAHPLDGRHVFAYPWEGATLVGTTDVDHRPSLDLEPAITPEEVAYLMAAIEARFPALGLTLDDVLSTFAGVRPVVNTGAADPSKESRDHAIWEEDGLLTVTGGKLTTFRLTALQALEVVQQRFSGDGGTGRGGSRTAPTASAVLRPVRQIPPALKALDPAGQRRLIGRYGAEAAEVVAAAAPGELEPIPGTRALWAELRWAARAEAVVHLDDLLLRRVRLGLLLPRGAAEHLPRLRAICQPELGWDDERWAAEETAYQELIRCCYSLPDGVSESYTATKSGSTLPSGRLAVRS